MEFVKLKPAVKDYIWGGTKLKSWGKESDTSNIAECWELSFNGSGPSLIDSGIDKGKALKDVATKEDIGNVPSSFPFFPVLIKLIDSESDLSVQVHPSDDYALKNENQFGKTEMWHIIDHEEGSGIYLGFKQDYSHKEVEAALKSNSILSLLNFFPVKNGDTYFIPSGTIHAIGGGVTLIEIQQNSTLTYRLYDYGRIGKDGKPRELHIKKALNVISYKKYEPPRFKDGVLGDCRYFVAREETAEEKTLEASSNSFLSITFLEGEGVIGGLSYRKGDTFFLPAKKKVELKGTGKMVLVEVKG